MQSKNKLTLTENSMNAVTTVEAGAVTPVAASQDQNTALMAVIARAAADPQVDIDKLERLLAMQERVMSQAAEQRFNAAMSAAQSEMGRVATDADNPQTRSRYATYGALDRAVRPVYTSHGFSLSFDTGAEAPEGYVVVTAYVSHVGGFTRTYNARMPADGKGAKGGDVMTKTHAFGAGASYGMRYLLKLIFNIAIGEDDNDGNATSPHREAPRELLDRANKAAAGGKDAFTDFWKALSVDDRVLLSGDLESLRAAALAVPA